MKMSLSYLELSKEALLHNIATFRALIGNAKLCMVVKANAYGHGMKEIVSIADGLVDYFQVDDIEELRALRQLTQTPILVLGYVAEEDLREAVLLDAILAVFDDTRLQLLNAIGAKCNKTISVHIEVDALLGRLGILDTNAEVFFSNLTNYPHVSAEAIYAHFSDIEDTDDLTHARAQYEVLMKVKEISQVAMHHISATSGILADQSHNWGGQLLRLGIGAYGLWPSEQLRERYKGTVTLQPVLSWKSHVAQVKVLPKGYAVGYGRTYITDKETKVAIIPQGYSDGYDRGLSNKGTVLIGDTRCSIIGRVAMNMIVADVTGKDIAAEDEVVLMGAQGTETISAEDIAQTIGTINYEVVARLSALLPRIIV